MRLLPAHEHRPTAAPSLVLLVVSAMFVASPRTYAAELLPVDGPPTTAQLLAADANWLLTFKTPDGNRQMPAADLVRFGSPTELRRGPVLVLGDGSLLVAEVTAADNETLSAESFLFGHLKLPLERLAGVVFQLPADLHDRDQLLDRVGSSDDPSDYVVLTNGDRVTGRFQGIRDAKVLLQTDAGPIEVQRHRVRALVFNPALVQRDSSSTLRAVTGFSDGSRLLAAKLEITGDSLQITSAKGPVWNTAREELVFLQPLGGKAVYLSDLKAADYRFVPFLDLSWPYHTDRSATGSWLRAGHVYLKGLGLHSAARLTYQLDRPYRRLNAQLAVDDSAQLRGSVRLRVFVDGALKVTSPILRGGMQPEPISVDLHGAKRIDLVVDFADRADVLDRADILEARLVE